jgi:hypothetical protein
MKTKSEIQKQMEMLESLFNELQRLNTRYILNYAGDNVSTSLLTLENTIRDKYSFLKEKLEEAK